MIWALLLVATGGHAQQYDIPLNHNITEEVNTYLRKDTITFHQGIKPYNQWYLPKAVFNQTFKDSGDYYYDITVLMFQKHLLEIHQKDVHIGMDLLFDVYYGRRYFNQSTNLSNRTSTNTRGFRVVANIGKNISIETRFYENQFFYPNYLDSIAKSKGIAFGVGRTKPFKTTGLDVGNSQGWVNYKTTDWLNIKFGHGKLFYGHGYRSILLSDNASSYPMLNFHLQSKNKKWSYVSAYAWMQTLSRSVTTISTEALFKRKNASIHYLSFIPTKNLEIGLFESTIFKAYDDSLGFVRPQAFFYNPMILLNTAVNGLQGSNNSLLGLNISYQLNHLQLYGQVAFDDLTLPAIQLGTKYYEPFQLEKTWIQIEYNHVPSYMYTQNTENILQNYTHLNQELAHPIGASFHEINLLYHFYKNRWFVDPQISASYRIRNSFRQAGENILIPNDLDLNTSFVNEDITTLFWKVDAGYQFNIKTRLQIFGSVSQRILNNLSNASKNQRDFYFVLGIRCPLNNFYYDL